MTIKKMMLALCILYILPTGFAKAQTIEQYTDWRGKPCQPADARFYIVIKNTDSGWLRNSYYTGTKKLFAKGLFKDSSCKQRHGRMVSFYANGNMAFTGNYINNKGQGAILSYHPNGMIKDSGVYNVGKPTGNTLAWYPNGYLSDSTVHNGDGTATRVSWFSDGTPSQAGKYSNDKKEGTWVYYHKSGAIAAKEKYGQDKLLDRIYYDESGNQLTDTANRDRPAQFTGGMEAWKKFLTRNLVFPTGYKLVNTNIVTVVINAVIDEEGAVQEAYVDIPFNTEFDKEALRVIKKSPAWIPAVDHNRRVRWLIRQPVSFYQGD